MDLTQLANLGEFIGGVAVLVTLVYLAVQIRHTRQQQQLQNAGIAIQTSMYASEALFLGNNPEMIQRGLEDLSALRPEERPAFHLLLSRQLAGLGALDRSDDPLCQAITAWYRDHFYGTPGGAQWLREFPEGAIKARAETAMRNRHPDPPI